MHSTSISQNLHLLHVTSYGEATKPRIVLLHGIATHGKIWSHAIDALSDNYHVVCIDLLGHGASPKPTDLDYTAAAQAACIEYTLRKHGYVGKSIVIGFSIGALIAVKLAAHFPQLVQSLILIAPPVYGQELSRSSKVVDTMYYMSYSAIGRLPEEFTLKSLQLIRRYAPVLVGENQFDRHTWKPIMSTLKHTVQSQSIEADLQQLRPSMPIRLLYGSLDHVVLSRQVEALSRLHENLQLHKVRAPHAITPIYTKNIVKLLQPVSHC